MEAKREEVIKTLMAMAVLYEKTMSEDAADILLNDLSDYPTSNILKALKLCRMELSKFPTVSDIVKRMSTQADQTQVHFLIGKIYSAIRCHGYSFPDRARAEIGERGWKAVMYFGGWKAICDYPAENDMALRSQLRNALEASVNEDARSLMLGIAMASGDDVGPSTTEPRTLVFNMQDYR